jgi:class 3 adenylate cyclase
LANTSARVLVADDYPAGFTPEQADRYIQLIRDKWGTDELTRLAIPHITDAHSIRMRSRHFRGAATPTQAARHWRYLFDFDARSFLPTISVPTIVLHRESFVGAPIEHGEYIANEIANAKFVRLPGGDGSVLFNEDATDRIDDLVEFVTGHPVERESSRSLKTILFCDIVNSTKRAADLGDRDWHELLQRFYTIVREELRHFGGKEIDSVGDGFFMVFERPTRALNCASAIRVAVKKLHLQVRFGAHTGECTISREKLTGMAVHIGARIAAAANADEIWVSETVKVLAMGSGIQFSARGTHELKGVPDQWSLYAVGGELQFVPENQRFSSA